MKVIRNPKQLQRLIDHARAKRKRVGFVPTMGALHEGHLSLVKRARSENNIVVVSIFVNALQFGPREDFKKYPRTFARDQRLLKGAKVDYLFAPNSTAMYGHDFHTSVELLENGYTNSLTNVLCGKSRPGHFRGVTTIVSKLFHITKPHVAYFGAKDYQQAAVISQMVRDLNFDLRIKVLPTVREKDGLALSSRNQYLSAKERERSLAISKTLRWMKKKLSSGNVGLSQLKREARHALRQKVDRIEYLEVVDPKTLQSLKRKQKQMVALVACFVGKTRLIDNVIIKV